MPENLDIVAQRFDGPPFDLVVATNVFVYYDTLDQCLALANVEAMLRPGGLLLSNNALLELPASRMRSAGYLTVQYFGSSRRWRSCGVVSKECRTDAGIPPPSPARSTGDARWDGVYLREGRTRGCPIRFA